MTPDEWRPPSLPTDISQSLQDAHCWLSNLVLSDGQLVLKQRWLLLKLNRFSAKPLLGHHALVWVVGFRMAGFMLSGSGIRVFVIGNVELG